MHKQSKIHVRKRHHLHFAIIRPFFRLFAFFKYGFRAKRYKIKKGENYFILSNHQSLLDPFFLSLSFNKAIYFVATDNLFNQRFVSSLLTYFFAPISKKKAVADPVCIKNCLRIAKEGGNVGLFVEGNRAWADFQFYIDPSIAKLVRAMHIPLLIYNLHGGYGVDPRWNKKIRKGKFFGEVTKVLSIEEIDHLSNDELYQLIVSSLKVIDSESGELYKGRDRAEYLERELFICPKCRKMETLYSHKEKIICRNCQLEVEYQKDLHLFSIDPSFTFKRLVDWYEFQLSEIKNYKVVDPDQTILQDEPVQIFLSDPNVSRQLLSKGKLQLTAKALTCESLVIPMEDILSASPVGGFKLVLTTIDHSYLIKGHCRFNPLKYTLFFNVLPTKIKERGGDDYYGLTIHR